MRRFARFGPLLCLLLVAACALPGPPPAAVFARLQQDAGGFVATGPVSSSDSGASMSQTFRHPGTGTSILVSIPQASQNDLAAGLNAPRARAVMPALLLLQGASASRSGMRSTNRGTVVVRNASQADMLRCWDALLEQGMQRARSLSCLGVQGGRLITLLLIGPDTIETILQLGSFERALARAHGIATPGSPAQAAAPPDAVLVPDPDAVAIPDPPTR